MCMSLREKVTAMASACASGLPSKWQKRGRITRRYSPRFIRVLLLRSMRTADFDFNLPQELIALRPSEKRDCSRLLVLHRDGTVEHKRFFEIIDYLEEGDMMLMNNTKVFPARIIGKKSGGQTVDMLLVSETADKAKWEILCRGNADGPLTVFDGINAEIETQRLGDQNEKKRYLKIPESAVSELNDLLWKYGY